MLRDKLSNRLRITYDLQKMEKSSERKIKYYEKYAFLVFETLKDPLFQKHLHQIIKNENIEIDLISDIQVKTFPLRKENGNNLAGKSNNKDEIYIYPKEVRFYQKLVHKLSGDNVNFYITSRARATLIHEVLHQKYLNRELKVRELTRKYFKAFIHLKKPDKNKQLIVNKLLPKTT